jgi:hypothetical protein
MIHEVELLPSPVPDTALRILATTDLGAAFVPMRAHRQRQLEQRMLLGAGWRDHDLLFARVNGEPLHPGASPGCSTN